MKTKFSILLLGLLVLLLFAVPALAQLPYTPIDRLLVNQDATFVGPVTVEDSLSIDGVTVSGGVIYGSQVAATDGVTITHGLGATPAMIILQPVWTTSTVTQTVYPANISDTIFTIELSTGPITNTTVYWQVGK